MVLIHDAPALSCRSVESSEEVRLTWIRPTAVRDQQRLDSWCRAVGPVVVSSVDQLPNEAEPVAVVSWNTNVGAGNVRLLVEKLRSGEFSGGVPIHAFVLLLQEVRRQGSLVPELPTGFNPPRRLGPVWNRPTDPDNTTDSDGIAEIAGWLGLNLVYAPAMRNGATHEDRGNAILSSFPLDEVAVIELPMERQRRIAIAATLSGLRRGGERWTLRAASVHLETHIGLLRDPAAARQRQARALIEALSSSSLPTVIAGDLNTAWGDDEPAVKDLRRAFPDAGRLHGTTWRGPLGLPAKLDHLFARIPGTKLEVHRVPDRLGSDHHPLVAIIP